MSAPSHWVLGPRPWQFLVRTLPGVLLAIAGGAFVHGAAAQTQAELRGGLTVGSISNSAAALEIAPSMSFDIVVRRQIHPRIAAFGGYFRTAFGCEEGYCKEKEITITGNHGALGVEWGRGGPWVRLGLLFGSTRAGSEGESPDLGVGVHGAAGLSVGTGRFRFLPGVSYRWLSANTPSNSAHAVALALDLGVGIQVGGDGG